jgi:hypothetical protein
MPNFFQNLITQASETISGAQQALAEHQAQTHALVRALGFDSTYKEPRRTLHIRRLEKGLERRNGRSRPTPWRLASLVGIDAFAVELTRGNIGTILATIKIENTQRYREVLWLGNLDSNQD